MENLTKAEIIENYINRKGIHKERNKYGLSKYQVRYLVEACYRGWLRPSAERETITIQSIINYDEEYYRELFEKWNVTARNS